MKILIFREVGSFCEVSVVFLKKIIIIPRPYWGPIKSNLAVGIGGGKSSVPHVVLCGLFASINADD